MLDDLTTYRLQDFLLFDAETYQRLFALMNEPLWLLPAVTVLAGLATLAALLASLPIAMRAAAAVLAAAFALTGAAFFLGVYATINWAAVYPAWLFFGQAGLLVAVGTLAGRLDPIADRASPRALLGTIVTLYALAIHPLTGFAAGRTWPGLEWFGPAPDPTALAALGFLSFSLSRWRFVLALAPFLWLVVSILTLWTLGLTIEAVLLAAGSALGMVALFLPAWAPTVRASEERGRYEPVPASADRLARPAGQPKPATLVPTSPLRSGTRRR
jgi:hypothetical protein